jgi:putative tryptophan/tyrosine transport system substrate-binding protein
LSNSEIAPSTWRTSLAVGVSSMNYVKVGPKRLELLRELIPTATIMASLVHPTNPNAETISRNVSGLRRSSALG